MLTSTFIHIDNIGVKKEQQLYESGIRTWWDAMANPDRIPMKGRERDMLIEAVYMSLKHFMRDDVAYFAERLPHSEFWRILLHYKNEIGYTDIETSMNGEITVIGLYVGGRYFRYVHGDDSAVLEYMFSLPRALITFNGLCFDVPEIKKAFPYLRMPELHFDLLKVAHSAGLKGGLKKIEKSLNIERTERVDGLTGYDAVKLWEQYLNENNAEALETLIEYNMFDVVNLEHIFNFFCQYKVKSQFRLS